MKIRTTYIVLFIALALCLLALDRLLVRNYTEYGRQLLAEMVHEHAGLCEAYFAVRVSQTKGAAAAIERAPAEMRDSTFQLAADTLLQNISGVERILWWNEGAQPYRQWPATPLGEALEERQLTELAQSERMSNGAAVSDAIKRSDGGYSFIVVAPVLNGRDGYLAISFRLQSNVAPAMRTSDYSRPLAYLEDASGTVLLDRSILDPRLPEMKETFVVGNASWTAHVHQAPAYRMQLILQRMVILAIGLLLLLIAITIYWLHTNHVATLTENNLRLETQARVTQRFNERLIRLNHELDEFTYVVSHDLKEPLRGVEGLTRLFQQEYGSKLDEQAQEYLRSIRGSGARMRQLVDDLLRLSRITRRRYPVQEVDFNELAREVLQTLDYTIQSKAAKITVQPQLPKIICDRVRMAELLQNLLSNALKFTANRQPEIEVSCRETAEGHLFWVRDNGIGIAPADHARVFEIFQRLDSAHEGSGVGLTICKRIIENHGGRIWVESIPGHGATFLFVLPHQPTPADPTAETDTFTVSSDTEAA